METDDSEGLVESSQLQEASIPKRLQPAIVARNLSRQGSTKELSSKDDVLASLKEAEPAKLTGWLTTQTKDDARDKAVASHETMGLVSALLAGFELQALVEVDTCVETTDCGLGESLFVIAASYCVGLAMIVVLEVSFEYMFVMRELHHGADSAWNLIEHFRFCRRAAEFAFALEILVFIISTGLMVYVRFVKTLPKGTTISLVLLGFNMFCIITVVILLQNAKRIHGQGAKQKREDAELEHKRLGRAHKRHSLTGSASQRVKRGSAAFLKVGHTCQVAPAIASDADVASALAITKTPSARTPPHRGRQATAGDRRRAATPASQRLTRLGTWFASARFSRSAPSETTRRTSRGESALLPERELDALTARPPERIEWAPPSDSPDAGALPPERFVSRERQQPSLDNILGSGGYDSPSARDSPTLESSLRESPEAPRDAPSEETERAQSHMARQSRSARQSHSARQDEPSVRLSTMDKRLNASQSMRNQQLQANAAVKSPKTANV